MKEKDRNPNRRIHAPSGSASINSIEAYETLYRQSLEEPERFWALQAETYLSWEKKWDDVLAHDFSKGEIQWFKGSRINAASNCIDRHLKAGGNKTALIWEPAHQGLSRTLTYAELYKEVNRAAGLFQSLGIAKGERIALYLPEIPELAVAMLACARIGAVACMIHPGFSAICLAAHLENCGAKLIITADAMTHAGRIIPLKSLCDHAVSTCWKQDQASHKILVVNHAQTATALTPGRDLWWQDAMEKLPKDFRTEPEPMDTEAPLFMIHTTSHTEKLKGIIHTHGGYLLYAAMTTHLVLDPGAEEILWNTVDITSIMGHTYKLFGPLLNGMTTLLFEEGAHCPDSIRYWELIEKYKVNRFIAPPSLINALKQADEASAPAHDLSSLKWLGTGTLQVSDDAWQWFHKKFGKSRCPLVNLYSQTECGGVVLTSLPGQGEKQERTALYPFPGIDAVLLDDIGEKIRYPGQGGVLCIKKPWPGMARTIHGDHDWFVSLYFDRIPGFYFSGDGALGDEQGRYAITGRIDDTINVAGFRIDTAAIESALEKHRLVDESAVVGFPHPMKVQGIYAFVSLKDKTLASTALKEELNRFIQTEIGIMVSLDAVQWTDGLPRTRSGKILRNILVKIAAGEFKGLDQHTVILARSDIEKLIKGRREATML